MNPKLFGRRPAVVSIQNQISLWVKLLDHDRLIKNLLIPFQGTLDLLHIFGDDPIAGTYTLIAELVTRIRVEQLRRCILDQ